MYKMLRICCFIFCLLLSASVMAQPGGLTLRPLSNYFLDDKVELHKGINCMVVSSKKDFDKLFGITKTATNHPDMPDFEKEMVLIIATPASNKETELKIKNAMHAGTYIDVFCTKERDNAPLTYSWQSIALVAIPKLKEVNKVNFYKGKQLITSVAVTTKGK